MTRELERFVKTYRVAEAATITVKTAFQLAANSGKADKTYVACTSSKLHPDVFEEAVLVVAREQFTNVENLKAINRFLESPIGRKVTDEAMKWYVDNFKRITLGLEPLPLQPSGYTDQELDELRTWEKQFPYADLKRFVEVGLKNLRFNDAANKRFAQIKRECTTLNRAPVYPAGAKMRGESGTVVLRVFVHPSGTADRVEVNASSGFPELDESAVAAVQTWKFKGASANGEWVKIPIKFELGASEGS